ncbi:MAG: hypothetical protein NVSMB70_16930 [Chamaesiphon sp.]
MTLALSLLNFDEISMFQSILASAKELMEWIRLFYISTNPVLAEVCQIIYV